MYYSNQKSKLSDKEWMESVTGQIGLKVNEGYGEDAMDAKMYFHDKLKKVLASAAGAFELQGKHDANELNPVNEFLGRLITILPKNAGSIKGGIGELRKEIFDKLKEQPQQPQQQANGQTDTPPPLPPGYGQEDPGKWSPNYR